MVERKVQVSGFTLSEDSSGIGSAINVQTRENVDIALQELGRDAQEHQETREKLIESITDDQLKRAVRSW
jgi:hypothetical protein